MGGVGVHLVCPRRCWHLRLHLHAEVNGCSWRRHAAGAWPGNINWKPCQQHLHAMVCPLSLMGLLLDQLPNPNEILSSGRRPCPSILRLEYYKESPAWCTQDNSILVR